MENLFSSICRVCEEKSNLINISSTNYIYKFMNCANVTYQIDDGLPPYLCDQCIEKLDNAYDFKLQCEMTHNKFLSILLKDGKHSNTNTANLKTEFIDTSVKDEQEFEHNNAENDTHTQEDMFPQIDESANEDLDENKIKRKKVKKCQDKDKEPTSSNVSSNTLDNSKCWYYCDICKTRCGSRHRIVEHLRRYHKMKQNRYQCPYCNKSLLLPNFFERHLADHTQQHICPFCSNLYTKGKYLRRHIRHMHEKIRKTCEHGCPLTGKHLLCMHLKQLHFKCKTCGHRYKTQSNLDQHELIHLPEYEGKKPRALQPNANFHESICQYCGKLSKTRSAEILHLRTHTGEKPYECMVCGNRFMSVYTLRIHNYMHTGEKPYKCETCGVHFRTTTHLILHKRVHTGEKPYKCQYCGKEFSYNSNLKPHLRIHTGETPYKCQHEHCAESFKDLNGLKRHRKKMHEI